MSQTFRFLAIGGLLAAFGFVGMITARADEPLLTQSAAVSGFVL